MSCFLSRRDPWSGIEPAMVDTRFDHNHFAIQQPETTRERACDTQANNGSVLQTLSTTFQSSPSSTHSGLETHIHTRTMVTTDSGVDLGTGQIS